MDQVTIESLQASLNQALEERKAANQKIDGLKKTFSDFIAKLQAMENTIQVVPPTLTQQVSTQATVMTAAPSPVEQSQAVANTLRETLADVLKKVDGDPTTDTSTQFGKIFWSYIVPAAIMFALLWFAMSYIKSPEAKACSLVNRVRARVQMRKEARAGQLADVSVNTASEELVDVSQKHIVNENPNKAKVHLAIVDLIVDLNTLDMQYASGDDTMLFFEQVDDKWDALEELLRSKIPALEAKSVEDKTRVQSEKKPESQAPKQQVKTTVQAEPVCADGMCAPVSRKPARGLFRVFR